MEEITGLRLAVDKSDFSPRYKAILLTLIEEIVAIKKTKKEKQAELERIRRMLAQSSEKRSQGNNQNAAKEENPPSIVHPRNHGRHGAKDYKFSKTTQCSHQELKTGQSCPDCDHGTLQEIEPRKIIRLIGKAPIDAELYQPARLRCGGCGKIFTAELPPEIGEEKADASANALVAVFRYGMGIPHYRLAQIQRAMGVPLPASTQYEMVEMLWTQVVPVFKELLHQAANWPLMFVDDTPAKVLELMKGKAERKAAGERVGIFTTAIVAQHEGRHINLFFTGRNHAGENLRELLEHRNNQLFPPIQMSDALSRNMPQDDGLTIVSLCLIHGRRNFIDCETAFPDEAAYVIERIALVYKHEKHCREKKLDDHQRLIYHQQNSQKPMDEIRAYADQKLKDKEVEPNSVLGQAFQYLQNHWTGMTRFLSIPGAPIDNNAAERLIKRCIMHRKNSLFYKTENGARVGDCLMSLIQTCIAADESPFEYLTVLQKNSRHVAKNPHLWLPWNYRNTMRSIGPPSGVPEKSAVAAEISA
ncbi:MAG: IS66 family transposase [Candidatus Ozemobacteraceae bacterium]